MVENFTEEYLKIKSFICSNFINTSHSNGSYWIAGVWRSYYYKNIIFSKNTENADRNMHKVTNDFLFAAYSQKEYKEVPLMDI